MVSRPAACPRSSVGEHGFLLVTNHEDVLSLSARCGLSPKVSCLALGEDPIALMQVQAIEPAPGTPEALALRAAAGVAPRPAPGEPPRPR